MGKLITINPNVNFSKLDKNADISFIPMERIDENYGIIKMLETKKRTENKGFTKFQDGDLLWAKITPCMQNGKSAIAENLVNGLGCGSTEFFVIRPNTSEVLVKYIHFILRDERILKNAENFFGGSAGQQRVSKDFLLNLLIPVPPIEIQQQIIDIMDAAYEEQRQKEQQAQELLAGINSYLLDELGIVMPPEEEKTLEQRMFYVGAEQVLGGRFDAFFHRAMFVKHDNSIQRSKCAIARLGDFIHYITYGASVDNCYVESGIPLLRIKNLKPNEIDSQDVVYLPEIMASELRTSRVNTGDILISRSGTIGVCSVVNENHTGYAFGSFMIKFSLSGIDPRYVSFIINSDIGKVYFERHKIGAIQGNITIPTIKSFLLPIPDLAKQSKIIQNVEKIIWQAKYFEQQAQDAISITKTQVEKILLEGSL